MLPVAWLLMSALVVANDVRPREPEVRAADGKVTIHAQDVPLYQILDRLSSATGMELTYQGERPTTPVTVSVDGVSESDAILKLMEGLGVSYLFRTDAPGKHVDLLIVSGAGARVAATVPSASADTQEEEPVATDGQIPLDPAVAASGSPEGTGARNTPPAPVFPQAASYPLN